MRILITGASGQLGQELTYTAPTDSEVLAVSRAELDIADQSEVLKCLEAFRPHIVINAAAYTQVDKAESEPELAFAVNCDGPRYLAEACSEVNSALIHISTDFVFDGNGARAYEVDSPTNPLGAYGTSKRDGEIAIIESSLENYTIIRTSWVYSRFGSNFLKTMLRLMSSRDSLGVVADQIGSPTSAYRLAEIIWKIARRIEDNQFDSNGLNQKLFHWSDAGVATWYDFAVAIYRASLQRGLLDRKVAITGITAAEYPLPALRPGFSVLNTFDIRKALELPCNHWGDELEMMLELMVNENKQRKI